MKNNNQVWISAEDLQSEKEFVQQSNREFVDVPAALNDFVKEEKTVSGRRDFLKYLGFSVGAATIASACDTPIRKALPYVTKPDAIVPGVATYYASNFYKGSDFCPVIVKTREGRPIKIEGNLMSPLTEGGTSARAQASVLELYDNSRFKTPMIAGDNGLQATDWESLDHAFTSQVSNASAVRILSHSNYSPSVEAAIASFKSTFPNTRLVTYDPISVSGILLANEKNFGVKAIPSYRFNEADLIVNFGADFLGTWVSPVEFARQYSKKRKVVGTDAEHVARLIQFESNMSYTGSNADHRYHIKPSEQGLAIAKLYNAVAAKTGSSPVSAGGQLSEKAETAIETVADLLTTAKGKSIVLSSSNNTAEQELVNAINVALGNYNHTISFDSIYNTLQGVDSDLARLEEEIRNGQVEALIVLGEANPAFDNPWAVSFAENLSNVNVRVSCAIGPNETSAMCNLIAPSSHYLESWGDVNPKTGYFGITQPTIHPLFDTRTGQESFLSWAGKTPETEEDKTYAFIKQVWEETIFPQQSEFAGFRAFWDNALHNGFVEITQPVEVAEFQFDGALASRINQPSNTEEILFYEPMGIGAGLYANNPWLQEMPDPVTRAVWDNVLHIPLKWNGRNDFEYFNNLDEDGLLVDVTLGENSLRIPIVRQFGQMEGTFAIALGYGRTEGGRAAVGVGVNCFPMVTQTDGDGNIQYFATAVGVSRKVGKDDRYASVQHHHTLGVTGQDETRGGEIINVDEKAIMELGSGPQGGLTKRSIFRYGNVDHLEEAVEHLVHEREHFQHLNEQTLYPDYSDIYGNGHHWGMSVDLSACIGCGACQVACVAENNVPVVGKVEVNRHHEMTWMRIDRYYYGDVENPNVVYQPMMCQHCDNAPCENVCPVAATNHSSEGLNQMAYNRCVGTRYCANNCPYKVRRFNWLDYMTADLFPINENKPFDNDIPFYADNLTRMVLNPDVTVRSRGVIEKCSMCVQRIQEGKLRAKSESRQLQDGDIKTACQTACPTGAIVFGDQNNHEGELHKLFSDEKNYFALEETNVRSSVGYMMKVLNKSEELEA